MTYLWLVALIPFLYGECAGADTVVVVDAYGNEFQKRDVIDYTVDDSEDNDVVLTEDDRLMAASMESIDLTQLGIDVPNDTTTVANKAEGDIAIADIQQFVTDANIEELGRNAIKSTWRKWSDGKIPYSISSQYGTYSRGVIAKAMREFEEKTCLTFVGRTTERDYIRIWPDDGCYSLVGRVGGKQTVSLTDGCIDKGTIIHELMHVAGFFHEQSRADRDEWIEIDFDEVISGAEDQFETYSLRTIDHLDEEYDYSSIMHYGPFAFSRFGRRTIRALKPLNGKTMGQRSGFSVTDLRKVNKLYNCKVDADSTTSIGGGGIVAPGTEAPPSSCKDNESSFRCRIRAFLGQCNNSQYRTVILATCAKSCNKCAAQPPAVTTTRKPTTRVPITTTTTTTLPPPIIPVSCVDNHAGCSNWAKFNFCERAQYKVFVRKTCPKSCNACPAADDSGMWGDLLASSGVKICQDTSPMCPLARWGQCEEDRASDFVRKNCKKTCKNFC